MVQFYIEKIKSYLLKVPWFKCILIVILMIISSNISYIAKYYPQNLEYQAIYYDSYELGGKEAMRLWAQGVKTTEFVEKVKEQMDE